MRNRPIFIKVKNFVDAQGYTIEQIQNVTTLQVKNLLNLTNKEYGQYCRYVDGIKTILIKHLLEEKDIQILVDIKTKVHTWLITRFPDYEAEKDFHDKTNRKIIIHLDGKG